MEKIEFCFHHWFVMGIIIVFSIVPIICIVYIAMTDISLLESVGLLSVGGLILFTCMAIVGFILIITHMIVEAHVKITHLYMQ